MADDENAEAKIAAYFRPPLNSKSWDVVAKYHKRGFKSTNQWVASKFLTKCEQVLDGEATGDGGNSRSAVQSACDRFVKSKMRLKCKDRRDSFWEQLQGAWDEYDERAIERGCRDAFRSD